MNGPPHLEEQLPGMSQFGHMPELSTKGLRFDPGNFRLMKSFWSRLDIGLSIANPGPFY